jgi:hypothetical protein
MLDIPRHDDPRVHALLVDGSQWGRKRWVREGPDGNAHVLGTT